MLQSDTILKRREFFTTVLAGAAVAHSLLSNARAQEAPREVFFERPAEGMPQAKP